MRPPTEAEIYEATNSIVGAIKCGEAALDIYGQIRTECEVIAGCDLSDWPLSTVEKYMQLALKWWSGGGREALAMAERMR